MSEQVEVTADVRLMSQVDGEYHHVYVAVDGRPVARLTSRGFWTDNEWLSPAQRHAVEDILRMVARKVGNALEGVTLTRGALWRAPPEPLAVVSAPEVWFAQKAAGA